MGCNNDICQQFCPTPAWTSPSQATFAAWRLNKPH